MPNVYKTRRRRVPWEDANSQHALRSQYSQPVAAEEALTPLRQQSVYRYPAEQRPPMPEKEHPHGPIPRTGNVHPAWQAELKRLDALFPGQKDIYPVRQKALLSPIQLRQIEQESGPDLQVLLDLEKQGNPEAIAAQLKQIEIRSPAALRHPIAQRIQSLQSVGGLTETREQKFAKDLDEKRQVKEQALRLTRQGNIIAARKAWTSLSDLYFNELDEYANPDPDTGDPVDVAAAKILNGTASSLIENIQAMKDVAEKADVAPEDLLPRLELQMNRLRGLHEKAYTKALGQVAKQQAQQSARTKNIADTFAKLTPEEQQERRKQLSPEDAAALDAQYPGGLPTPKPSGATITAAKSSFSKAADGYLEELPEPSEWNNKAALEPDEIAELSAALSVEVLEQLRERFVADHKAEAAQSGIDENTLRGIWEQRFRAKKYKGVTLPPRPKADVQEEAALPLAKTPAEAQALPKGTRFLRPNGQIWISK